MATGLRRFREPRGTSGTSGPAEALCELCAQPAGEDHGHVVNVESRGLLCACRACHLLFTRDTSGRARYRAVPRRYLHAPRFLLGAADWDEMQIPVRTAFFFRNSAADRTVAFYPSPAGATESLLPLETWERVLAANPAMADVRPDVEALLVDRGPDGGFACHLVPIDACYELVGLVRMHWKGFDGGQEAREAIEGFFSGLRERGRTVPDPPDRPPGTPGGPDPCGLPGASAGSGTGGAPCPRAALGARGARGAKGVPDRADVTGTGAAAAAPAPVPGGDGHG